MSHNEALKSTKYSIKQKSAQIAELTIQKPLFYPVHFDSAIVTQSQNNTH